MPTRSPASEPTPHLMVEFIEEFLGNHGGVVAAPSTDDRVEAGDECRLRRGTILPHNRRDAVVMAADRICTGFDDGLEPKRSSTGSLARVTLSHRVVAYVEA